MYDGLKGVGSSTLHFAMKVPAVAVAAAIIVAGTLIVKNEKEVIKEVVKPKVAIVEVVRPMKKEVVVAVPKGMVLFDFDKYNIDATAKGLLEKIVVQMNKYPNKVLVLKGHTDKFGSNEYNQVLSENRANSVKDYLVADGISANRIVSVEGFGKTLFLPKMTNHQNRRVMILFVDK